MTDIADIYEAAGFELNETRTALVASTHPTTIAKSFEIVLKVRPVEIEFRTNEKPMVTFEVIPDPELEPYWELEPVEITLPVKQVKILKEK